MFMNKTFAAFLVLTLQLLNTAGLSWVQRIEHNDVRFTAPLLDEGFPPAVNQYLLGETKMNPLLLYLPGFDGTLLAPFLQFPELGAEFDVWGLTIDMEDRSTFEDLCNHVLRFLSEYIFENNITQSFYLMGESFGSLLAMEVAHCIQTNPHHHRYCHLLRGIVLINPATSYNQSQLAIVGPEVANLSPLFYPFGLIKLLPLFTDEYAIPQLILMLQGKALPLIINDKEREAYMGRVAFSLVQKLKFMPRETLAWRLTEWLQKGCDILITNEQNIASSLAHIPILTVVGEKDNALPSMNEGRRLARLFKDCSMHIVDGSGHANTAGIRINLMSLMRHRFGLQIKGVPMKEIQQNGVLMGMEERYDKKSFGLSPFLYWSPDVYQKCIY